MKGGHDGSKEGGGVTHDGERLECGCLGSRECVYVCGGDARGYLRTLAALVGSLVGYIVVD